MLKIGETIQLNGIDLLILDLINHNPFVIALDLNITSPFSDGSNNYEGSILESVINEWFEKTNLPAIPLVRHLTTMDGSRCYNAIEAKAAPLTFDEWRRYAKIIIPHLKDDWFWLATGWSDPKWENWGKDCICSVSSSGAVSSHGYNASLGYVVPAFLLDYSTIPSLALFLTSELLAEIQRRIPQRGSILQ